MPGSGVVLREGEEVWEESGCLLRQLLLKLVLGPVESLSELAEVGVCDARRLRLFRCKRASDLEVEVLLLSDCCLDPALVLVVEGLVCLGLAEDMVEVVKAELLLVAKRDDLNCHGHC